MLKVYIEENAFAAPQPMEVSSDAPISRVIPALVEELHLPSTDLFGNRLVYFLRHTDDGRVLPDHFTLSSAGIRQEDHLSLESYVDDEAPVLAAPRAQSASQSPSFYADQTIADARLFLAGENSAPPPQVVYPSTPAVPSGALPAPGGKRRSRRALLLLSGAVLGAAGAGLAYAALQQFSGTHPTFAPPLPSTKATAPARATAPTQATLPTRATSLLAFTRHQQTVRTVAWAPGGTLLASGANDRSLLTWDLNGQVQLRATQDAPVHATAWSPDNRQLAAAVANQVLFLNAQNGTLEAQPARVHRATVTTLAWSPRQPQFLVSAGLDRLAIVWNTQTFAPQTIFRQHTSGILSAGWASDGQTVGTCSGGGVIRVWNGPGGQQVHGFFFDGGIAMNALSFEPAGSRLAVGGADGVLRLWKSGLACQLMGNGAQGQCMDKPQHLTAHGQAIRAVAWSPDGRLLASAGDDGMLFIWSPAQSATPLLKIPHNAPVLALSWSPDGKKIASASGNTVTLWALV